MIKQTINKPSWRVYARLYQQVMPPFTPSKVHCRLYEKILRKVKKESGNRGLVLGCTPGFRDSLAKVKFETTILDYSPEMIKAMAALRKNKNREKKVIGLWTQAGKYFPKNSFDAVLGHAVTNNLLTLPLYERFFQGMNKILKPQGRLILSIVVPAPKPLKAEEMIKKCKRNPGYFRNLNNKIYAWESCAYGDPKFYNKRIYMAVINDQTNFMKKKLDKGEITKKEYQLLTFSFYNNPHRTTYLPPKVLERIIKKHFVISRKYKEPHFHRAFTDFYQIYCLRKK